MSAIKKPTQDDFRKTESKTKTLHDGTELASGGEPHQIAGGKHPPLTTNQGVTVSDNQNSLKSHPRGPTL